MSFLCALLAAGVVAPPTLFAGPAKAGDSVTYRISTTMSATQAPSVSTIVITWKAPMKLYARLAGSTAALAVTRTANGQLSLAAPNPADPTAPTIAALLNQMNFPGYVAASLGGSDHTQMSMTITPPAPASSASPAPAPPEPVDVPLDINLLSSTSGATLIATGNSNQRGSPSGADRGGGRGGGMGGGRQQGSMGGWHSSRSGRGQQQSNGNRPSVVDIAIQADFDQSGVLQHATYRERFTTQTSGASTVEHTITIDRVT